MKKIRRIFIVLSLLSCKQKMTDAVELNSRLDKNVVNEYPLSEDLNQLKKKIIVKSIRTEKKA
jgi:hypothetical protein